MVCRIAVINIDTGVTEVLFRHSGIKKNGIDWFSANILCCKCGHKINDTDFK